MGSVCTYGLQGKARREAARIVLFVVIARKKVVGGKLGFSGRPAVITVACTQEFASSCFTGCSNIH